MADLPKEDQSRKYKRIKWLNGPETQGQAEVIVNLGNRVSKGWAEEEKKRREAQKDKETLDKPVAPDA